MTNDEFLLMIPDHVTLKSNVDSTFYSMKGKFGSSFSKVYVLESLFAVEF